MFQYIYKTTLKPEYSDTSIWTNAEHDLLREHVQYLDRAFINHQLILAGSTQNSLPNQFGIVIFWANNEKTAYDFMHNDPVVKFGIMDAELFPYEVFKCSFSTKTDYTNDED